MTIQRADNAEQTNDDDHNVPSYIEEEMEEMVVMECQDLEVSLAEMVRQERKG